jgi:hypothetical protein
MCETLEDFLALLSSNERKIFVEEYLPKMMSQQQSILKRTTLKFSTDLPEPEIRKAISETMGIPIEQVPQFDFESEKARLRNEMKRIEMITKDYKAKLDNSTNVTQDKYDELFDVGKFILFANSNFKIEVPNDLLRFPDFILSFEEEKIGLEHTRLMNEETKAQFKTAKYYIKKAEELVATEFNHLSKTVNIFIDYNQNVIGESNFKNKRFTLEQRRQVAETLADYIKSELTEGNVPKPNYIIQTKITSNKDSRVDLELAESYFTLSEFNDILIERIQKKEMKANNYRNETNLNVIWLLIVIDDVNSFSGFDLKTAKFPQIVNSNFNSIFLFEKFGGKIYNLIQNVNA